MKKTKVKGKVKTNEESSIKKRKSLFLETQKLQTGITLIALIVTIIVLLILAGVTIATLTGDNGILTQANNAKERTEQAEEDEKANLAYTENIINKYIAETNLDLEQYIKIGDYVNCKPDSITDTYSKFGKTYSGYANKVIGQDNNLTWRILNINIDGTVDLISDKPTSTQVYFQGARGYNNGVYLLNDYCRIMYSNSSINAEGRSLNIEDIQEKMKVIDEETQKKAYEYSLSSGDILYGESSSYSSNRWYPLQWKNDNGINGESNQLQLIEYMTESDAKA